METELKKTIIAYIFDNSKEFQLHNATTNKFRNYIFDDAGNYLIGGQKIITFVDNAIKLIN